jgi:Flp pilus assembly secretin CpaC
MRRVLPSLLILAAMTASASALAGTALNKPPAKQHLAVGTTSTPALRVAAKKPPTGKHLAVAVVTPSRSTVMVAIKNPAAKKHLVRKLARKMPAPSISLPLDEVRVVAFSQPVSTVYVGNPVVADVSVIDSRHAFVLAKGFGATNIIALNSDGKQVVNEHVTVFGHTGTTVILHRGAAQNTYACANSRCEIAPTPGDDKESYGSRMDQIIGHQDAGLKAASAGR